MAGNDSSIPILGLGSHQTVSDLGRLKEVKSSGFFPVSAGRVMPWTKGPHATAACPKARGGKPKPQGVNTLRPWEPQP